MGYKLKTINGRVNTLLRTGTDLVKNNLSVSTAQHIIDTGNRVDSTVPDYPICIDDKWFFEGEEINTSPKEDNKPIRRGGKG